MTKGWPTILQEIDRKATSYSLQWRLSASERPALAPLAMLPVTAVGWKVVDPAQYDRRIMELRGFSAHIIETWMDNRWVAKCVLRDAVLSDGCCIIKIMQRRPKAKDPVGLDHIDLYCEDLASVEAALSADDSLQWVYESNSVYPSWRWISLKFNGHEIKFKDYSVLDVTVALLSDSDLTFRK